MARLAFVLPLLLLLGASLARAQQSESDTRARVHFQAATQYYDDGRFEEAVPEFREAWRLSQRPEMLLNLATAAEHALAFGDAASALTEYLQHVPSAENREAIERRITRNQDAATRMAHGQTVAADTTNTLTPSSTSPPNSSSSENGAHGSRSGSASGSGSGSASGTSGSPHSGMSGLGVAGLVTMGVGGAAMIGSLIVGLMANDSYASLEAACPMHVCLTDHSAEASSGRTLALTSTVLLFAGAGLAAAGVVLFAIGLGEHPADHASTGTLEILPGPGEAGLSARLRL